MSINNLGKLHNCSSQKYNGKETDILKPPIFINFPHFKAPILSLISYKY